MGLVALIQKGISEVGCLQSRGSGKTLKMGFSTGRVRPQPRDLPGNVHVGFSLVRSPMVQKAGDKSYREAWQGSRLSSGLGGSTHSRI